MLGTAPVMSERETAAVAWLIRVSGLESGRRIPLQTERTVIGRQKGADVHVRGESADLVSALHAVIEREDDGGFRIVDQESTNGLFLNGSEIRTARLAEGATIELGRGGPKYRFTLQAEDADSLFRHAAEASARVGETAANLGRAAVEAVRHPSRKLRRALAAAGVAVALLLAVGWMLGRRDQAEYRELNARLFEVEGRIEAGAQDLESLIAEAEELRQSIGEVEDRFWFRVTGSVRPRSFVEREIEALLEEFGAERYAVPGEFVRDVESYIKKFETVDRPLMERAFTAASDRFETMRDQFEEENLPPDLAYLVLVESSLLNDRRSGAGAAGLWQLRAATARDLGLRVDAEVDERHDPVKSTEAAAQYLKRMIIEFGSGSSVMLALAAYNVGPGRVRSAVRRVSDPIQQRNFWYLYRARLLPSETREFVPRILAAMIIGRNPERYGFS